MPLLIKVGVLFASHNARGISTGTVVRQDRDNASQVFAEYTISRIPYSVRSTFNESQLGAIREALVAQQRGAKHRLDVRLRIPLFFRAYYIVFFGGRDQRKFVAKLELERLHRLPKPLVRSFYIFAVMAVSAGAIASILLAVYLVKSFLGFDFFSVHLSEIIGVDVFGYAKQLFSSWGLND